MYPTHRRTVLSLFQGRSRLVFMATLSPQGMAILHPPSRRLLSRDCRSSRDSALTSSWNWMSESPPLTSSLVEVRLSDRLQRVLLLEDSEPMRGIATRWKLRGCNKIRFAYKYSVVILISTVCYLSASRNRTPVVGVVASLRRTRWVLRRHRAGVRGADTAPSRTSPTVASKEGVPPTSLQSLAR